MIPFPEPLHPAVVHFPIALLLLGALLAVAAVFFRRWHLPLFAAIVLSLGAIGAVAAAITGEDEEERVEHAIPSAEPVLEEHAEWGEGARNAGIVAALLAVAAVVMVRKRLGGRILSVSAAVAALVAGYYVAQAGHFGGELVYRHGAGVTLGAGGTGGENAASSKREHGAEEEGEEE
jgi:uncharacterized membrane protein